MMYRLRQYAFIVCAGLLCSSYANGESLLQVYERALSSDPLLREADALRLATQESKPQARSAMLPQVGFFYSWEDRNRDGSTSFNQVAVDDNGQPIIDPDTGLPLTAIVPNEFDNNDTTKIWAFELRQSVFRWDQWMTLRQSVKRVTQAEVDYQVAGQDLMLRVSQRYFNVLAAKDTLDSAEAALESTARQLEQAEKRFEVGLIAITDVQEAQAAYDNTIAAVIGAKRDLATALEFLSEITGDTYSELVEPGEDMPLAIPAPTSEEAWVESSLDQNLRMVSSRMGVDIARDEVRVQRAGHMPTVDFVANKNNFDLESNQINNGLGGQSDQDIDTDYIRLELNVPIFQGGRIRSNVREAVYRHRAAKEQLERVMRETEREARDAYLSLMAEISRVKALRRAVESSQTALEATEAGFEVGTRTTVDVLDARRRLFESETNYARSKYDYIINIIRLKLAAGSLSREDLAGIDAWLKNTVTTR